MANVLLPSGVTRNTYRLSAGDKLLGQVDGSSVLDGWYTIPAGSGNCEVGRFRHKLRQFVADGTVQSGGGQVSGSGAYIHDIEIDATNLTTQQGIQVQAGAADVRIDNIRGYGMRGPSQKDQLIYLANCYRAVVTDIELEDWTGGFGIHVYTGGAASEGHLIDRARARNCKNGGLAMAWGGGVKNVTFRNLTAEGTYFATHHVFSSWYTGGGIVFDRIKIDRPGEFYFGAGVTLTNEGIADLPNLGATTPPPPPAPLPTPVPEPAPEPAPEDTALAERVGLLERRELALKRASAETPRTSISKKYLQYRP